MRRLSRSGVAKVAAAALEDALLSRTIRPVKNDLHLRSENWLVFGSKDFSGVATKYRIQQEYITPYTPEQNGMIERFFRTIKEECIWLNRLINADEAFEAVAVCMDRYHMDIPHSALNYLTPDEFRKILLD